MHNSKKSILLGQLVILASFILMILACTSSSNVSSVSSNAEASDRAQTEVTDSVWVNSQYDVAAVQNPSLDCSLN